MTAVNKPPVASRREWLTAVDTLRARERAHTREGDAIAAARRRPPITEVDPSTPLIGGNGEVPLIDVFEGRTQLFVSYHMWHDGRPAADQCEGCTFSPPGRPQPYGTLGQQFRKDGRPAAQWARITAGHDDDPHSGELRRSSQAAIKQCGIREVAK
jgi:uncharacterized protein DUF899